MQATVAIHPEERIQISTEISLHLHERALDGMYSQEELEDVEVHQQHRDGHGSGESAIELILLHCVAQDQDAPSHHAQAAVGPGLYVKVLADARVQLHSPVVIVHQAACAA